MSQTTDGVWVIGEQKDGQMAAVTLELLNGEVHRGLTQAEAHGPNDRRKAGWYDHSAGGVWSG